MPLETSVSVKTAYRQISNISFSQGSVAPLKLRPYGAIQICLLLLLLLLATEIVAKLVAALLRVAGITAGLAESIGSLSSGL